MAENKPVILYDGECSLCNSIMRFIRKRDVKRKFIYIPLQSQEGQAYLQKFGLPTHDFSSFVYIKGDRHFVKSTAGLKVLYDLGGVWKLFYLFKLVPVPVRDWVYNLIAKNRGKCRIRNSNFIGFIYIYNSLNDTYENKPNSSSKQAFRNT